MSSAEFRSQVASLRGTLQGFTRRFTHDRDESLDLVQDTVLKALMYRDKFRTDTNLKGWLFTIMRNTFVNNYRRNKRARNISDLSNTHHVANLIDEHTFNRPQESMEFKEIWQNVGTIKDELMTPFKMHTSGYKYNEIAEHLNIPVGTVKNRIFHARKEIQKKLHGYR
jgi:RNA polymerase sigma-70 factor (ECF subfamily)